MGRLSYCFAEQDSKHRMSMQMFQDPEQAEKSQFNMLGGHGRNVFVRLQFWKNVHHEETCSWVMEDHPQCGEIRREKR